MTQRKPPVFIIGCPRSGTTLLYHILLSSGGFAVYRSETNAFDLIALRYGDLRTERDRREFLDKWLRSYMFTRTGLDREYISKRILQDCRSAADFLRIVMEDISDAQNVDRWAECTPTHALHLGRIREAFPDAQIIHMIRDGRDAALSLSKLGWIRPFPWDRERELVTAGLYWKWMVETGRRDARRHSLPYLEVRFEDLVGSPHETTERIGRFIGHPIDYDQVLKAGIGSVSEPNTSFAGEKKADFNPIGRWHASIGAEALAELEAAIGDLLADLGYDLASDGSRARTVPIRRMRALYSPYFGFKEWVKANTPLSRRMVSTAILEQDLPAAV